MGSFGPWNRVMAQTSVSTTPLRQWGFRQCLPSSWTTLRGKHCRHPIAVMGVVDTFGLCLVFFMDMKKLNAISQRVLPHCEPSLFLYLPSIKYNIQKAGD